MQSNTNHSTDMERVKAPVVQMVIIILGVFMAILDTSVVNVAIPTIETAFGATTNEIQWVLTGYMLTMGVLIPISGWLTDRFGAKHIFLFALAMFTIGSALCGMSWNTSSIIVFRIVQALGGGFMMPVAMNIIYRLYPPERRGLVMGMFGISIMVAPAFGPALSGYLVEYSNWRLIFYINVPVGILAFILGLTVMHEFSHEVKGKFDILGFSLSTVGFFSLLYGLNEVPSKGWNSAEVILFLTIGLLSLVMLVVVELSVKNPVIQFRVFKDYMFSMSVVISSIVNVALFAGIFFVPIYLQNIVGLSPIRTGLLMMPAALASAIMMPVSGRLFDKVGARPLGFIGLAIVTTATIGFTHLGRNTSINYIQWMYILRSLGMGLTMMPIMTAGMNTLPLSLVSQGSALSNTVRQVAASLGIAVLTTVMTERSKFHYAVMAQNVTPFTPQGQDLFHLQQALQMQGLPANLAQGAAFTMLKGVLTARGAVAGLNDAFLVSAFLSGFALILIVFFGSKRESGIRLSNRQKQKQHKTDKRAAIALD